MSDDTSNSKSDLDLSSLTLAPSWVSDLESEGSGTNKYADYDGPPPEKRRGGKGGGRGNWGDGGGGGRGRGPGGGGGRPQGGGGGGGRPQGGNRRDGGGGRPQGDRQGRGGPRGGQGGGGRHQGRGGNFQRQEIRTAPGLTAKVQPTKPGIGALASMIKRTGRTYALIDLAKLVAAGRDRYEVAIEPDKKAKQAPGPLTFCTADGSLWLTKDEAIKHFIDSPAVSEYYGTEEVEVDPPKGNFTGVAVCGFSGRLLGPPNHHSYQTTIQELHREEFSNMSLERYKQRIRIETGEEIVEKWKALHGKRTEWIYPKPDEAKEEAPDGTPASPAEEAPAPEPVEGTETSAESPPEPAADEVKPDADGSSAGAAEESPAPEPKADAATEPEPEHETAAKPEAPAIESTRLPTRADLERHVREHLGEILFADAGSATVPGNIPGRNLSPLLFGNVKLASQQVNRAPSILIASLCNMLENEGLKLFRWGGKNLFAAAHRPHQLISDTPLSDSIRAIFEYISAMPKPKVTDLLEALASTAGEAVEIPTETPTKDAEAAPPKQLTPAQVGVLKDLRWLIGEGYVIEFSDGTLDAVRVRPKEQPKPAEEPTKETPEKEGAPKAESKTDSTADVEPQPGGAAPEPAADPVAEIQAPMEAAPDSPPAEEQPPAQG